MALEVPEIEAKSNSFIGVLNAFLSRNVLLLTLLAATVLAFVVPELGKRLKELGVVAPGIALIFICQGAAFDSGAVQRGARFASVLLLGALISFVAAPALGVIAMHVLGWEGDDRLGFLLMCSMAPTLASGIIIVAEAEGDRVTAMLLAIALNMGAVLAVPVSLGCILGDSVAIARGPLFLKLTGLILLPALFGQFLRRHKVAGIASRKRLLKLAPIFIIGLVVFVSLSEHTTRLRQFEAVQLLRLIVPAFVVHIILLGVGFTVALRLCRMPRSVSVAVAILCSQKTLPVAIAVWSTEFAARYPLALLPPIVFHLTQLYTDSFLAPRLWGPSSTTEPDIDDS
jgi:predicted Na+-dependent transporter